MIGSEEKLSEFRKGERDGRKERGDGHVAAGGAWRVKVVEQAASHVPAMVELFRLQDFLNATKETEITRCAWECFSLNRNLHKSNVKYSQYSICLMIKL
ncbi:hypothetical protein SLA2020_213530 [Shorea laevis]